VLVDQLAYFGMSFRSFFRTLKQHSERLLAIVKLVSEDQHGTRPDTRVDPFDGQFHVLRVDVMAVVYDDFLDSTGDIKAPIQAKSKVAAGQIGAGVSWNAAEKSIRCGVLLSPVARADVSTCDPYFPHQAVLEGYGGGRINNPHIISRVHPAAASHLAEVFSAR